MQTVEKAEELARIMVAIGNGAGKKTYAVITDMSQPLGNTVGNIVEVQEAIEALNGKRAKGSDGCCLCIRVSYVKRLPVWQKMKKQEQ